MDGCIIQSAVPTSSYTSKMAALLWVLLVVALAAATQALQITGPKYKPGDTITRTDFQSVDNALTDVLRAGSITEGRRCAIGVANLGSTELVNPRWYMYSGNIYSSAPYTIRSRNTGLLLFTKKTVSTYGTTGILSYDIEGTDYKVAVYWTVPWNELFYNTYFNFKIFPKNAATDKKMYEQLSTYAGPHKAEGWMEKNEYGIKVMGTITDHEYSKFYISVDTTEYSKGLGPQLHTDCDFRAKWLGSYCWQECTPSGYCWVNKKCNSQADCVGPLRCYDKCKST